MPVNIIWPAMGAGVCIGMISMGFIWLIVDEVTKTKARRAAEQDETNKKEDKIAKEIWKHKFPLI